MADEPTGQWEPPTEGIGGREEDWYRSCWWSHCAFCGCGDPAFHLALLSHRNRGPRGPPGGPPAPPPGPPPLEPGGPPNLGEPLPRFLPLPGLPPAPEQPPPRRGGGGGDAGDRGGRGGDGVDADWAPEDVDLLLAAVDEDQR